MKTEETGGGGRMENCPEETKRAHGVEQLLGTWQGRRQQGKVRCRQVGRTGRWEVRG